MSNISKPNPIKLTQPSISCFTGFLLIASIAKKTNLPPSKAGKGNKFIKNKFKETIAIQFKYTPKP